MYKIKTKDDASDPRETKELWHPLRLGHKNKTNKSMTYVILDDI